MSLILQWNFNHLLYENNQVWDEHFILAGQVEQVCYVQDPVDLDWHVVMKMTIRELYDKYSYSPLIMPQVELYLNNSWMRVCICVMKILLGLRRELM